MSEVVYRRAELGDHAVVQLALYLAVSWTNNPEIPPMEAALQHPDLARYHEGWGRPGDVGVIALVEGKAVGAAFARRFTDDDHGHGYVDAETPELGIGVVVEHRGKGIGRTLMQELATAARLEGVARLSLSVNNSNPVKPLYEALGYQTVTDDGESSIMVLDL